MLANLSGGRRPARRLSHAARAALDVQEGDTVRCVPLHQPHQEELIGRRTMIVVRVVQRGDVDALMRLAQETGPVSPPSSRIATRLAARVERARRTMEDKAAAA